MIDSGLVIPIPGSRPLCLRHLLLDFNGTLALDGKTLPGVRPRLLKLSRRLTITVLSADTFGTASRELRRLPVGFEPVKDGAAKGRFASARTSVVAIGNGRNDIEMLKASALALAVVGPEGACARLLAAADVVARDIRDALDLLLEPKRLTAALRR
jgi:soluble P-type ATPase